MDSINEHTESLSDRRTCGQAPLVGEGWSQGDTGEGAFLLGETAHAGTDPSALSTRISTK